MNIENMKMSCIDVSNLLKAISHPQRLMLLCHLQESEKTVGELVELCEISQSQISQFLARLKAERILGSRKEGQYSYYFIIHEDILKIMKSLNKIFSK